MRTISKNKVSRNTNNVSGISNKCRRIRTWLNKALNSRYGLDASWVQNHIASCPRCRRRLAAIGKVNLALSAMKAQPCRTDLLMRANIQAIGVLKHSLRQAPKARKLKVMMPEPKLLERWRKYAHPATNLAACVVILLLMKVGIFSSMDKFQAEGQKIVKQYYANHVGQDVANEIFSA